MLSLLRDMEKMTDLRSLYVDQMTTIRQLAIEKWGRDHRMPGGLRFDQLVDAESEDEEYVSPSESPQEPSRSKHRFGLLARALHRQRGVDVVDSPNNL